MKNTICILGATGIIGLELTIALLNNNEDVIAVVRDGVKLRDMLKSRGLTSIEENLTIISAELFSKNEITNSELKDAIKKSNYVFNFASPKMSWKPFSKINRKWGEPVSNLTRNIVKLGEETKSTPHVLAFCGPEYFKEYDGKSGGLFSLILKSLIGALRDNHIEATFLLSSDYEKWTVFRCGSIREWTGAKGDSSKIDMDLHKDNSDYRNGKGKSLIVEDLGVFLADLISNGKMSQINKEMPFVFNTRF